MKFTALAITALVAGLCNVAPARAEAEQEVNIFIGAKVLTDPGFGPDSPQFELGAQMSFAMQNWPVHFAVDVLWSFDEGSNYSSSSCCPVLNAVDTLRSLDENSRRSGSAQDSYGGSYDGSTLEIDLGVRKIWLTEGRARPYIGGGVAFIRALWEYSTPGAVDPQTGNAIGLWAGTGVFFRVKQRLNLGVDVRYSSAKVDFSPVYGTYDTGKMNVSGFHIGALVGWGW